MSDNLIQGVDALMIAEQIIGKTENVTIDSRIFKHYSCDDNEELLDESKDIIKIYGSKDKKNYIERCVRRI